MIRYISNMEEERGEGAFLIGKLKSEDIRKWIRTAEFIKTNENPCLSRQIGVVIVNQHNNSLISSGHNGPPDGTPSCDDEDYLKNVVWPQLTGHEKMVAAGDNENGVLLFYKAENFAQENAGCGQCPRRIIGAASGQRLELCSCAHGETNAITKAHRDVTGMLIVCSCGVPCVDCTKMVINSKLAGCIALVPDGRSAKHDYSPYVSRWLFEKSDTTLYLVDPSWVEKL